MSPYLNALFHFTIAYFSAKQAKLLVEASRYIKVRINKIEVNLWIS